jgi:hypothetical protein
MKDYASWYVELHPYQIGIEMSHRIAMHLVPRIGHGNAIIVCDVPGDWVATFRRRWGHVLRVLERERAAMTSKESVTECTRLINALKLVRFEPRPPYERNAPTVWLVHAEDLDAIPKGIMTMYVMSGNIGMSQLLFWAKQMDDESAVLLFRKQPLTATAPT